MGNLAPLVVSKAQGRTESINGRVDIPFVSLADFIATWKLTADTVKTITIATLSTNGNGTVRKMMIKAVDGAIYIRKDADPAVITADDITGTGEWHLSAGETLNLDVADCTTVRMIGASTETPVVCAMCWA